MPRLLHGLADGDAEAPRRVRVVLQDGPSRGGPVAGAGNALGPPDVHHHAPVGFLVVADPDHVDSAFQAEHLAGHGKGAAPLSGPRFRGETLDAEYLVVIGLGNGRVRLVRPRRAVSFIFVVDLHGGVEKLFEIPGPEEGRGTPQNVFFENRFGDVDPALRRSFLLDQVHGENRGEILRFHRLAGRRVERRVHGRRQVRHDVVPLPGDLVISQGHFHLFHGSRSFLNFLQFKKISS